MSVPTQVKVTAIRNARARTLRHAQLASGISKSGKGGNIQASLARFWSPHRHVDDYAFVDVDCEDIVRDAQRRLVWAHRLAHIEPPFAAIVLAFDRAIERQSAKDVKKAIKAERWRRSVARRDAMRGKRKARAWTRPTIKVEPQPKPKPKRRGRPTKAEELAKTKRLKKRTREERIADLQRALEDK